MTATRQRSSEAASLDAHARHYVDRVASKHYDGRIPSETAADIYRQAVGSEAQRRMMEELDPITRTLVKLAAMSLEPQPVPPAVEEMRQRIIDRWTAAVAELLVEKPVRAAASLA